MLANVLVGITGGIAAYKATGIIRGLTEAGHEVKVIPTANALRFIGKTTLEALSHNSVDPDLYSDVADVKHVELGQKADLVIVAPATAAFLARYAAGLADDLLLNTLLVTKAPVLVAPAMHTEMWSHATTVRNVRQLRSDGIHVLEPAVGRLTGQDSGVGRLPEAEEIVQAALALLEPQDLRGRRVIVTAGGTREPIDPVRFIGNRSSGKQGLAIARVAQARGADVLVIGANIPTVAGLKMIHVETAAELQQQLVAELGEADVLIQAAAVSDYRVARPSELKLKKAAIGEALDLRLEMNPDLLKLAVETRQPKQLIVGFAAETAANDSELEARALEKIRAKGCDLLVANNVSGGAVFDADDTRVMILDEYGVVSQCSGTKDAVARELVELIATRLRG
ncbi:MAG: bifunctional phosphopantothenoylcysteine decarboxylase/phosphopantothenate--cysteine ligase CoaBC [Actinomycetales bacterium]|nr:bifunctional phosphopantothenoylcysteine decarboxylase/phosphopantothenate--cysteine ligase CoaBC [Actinomycetales bacterium]